MGMSYMRDSSLVKSLEKGLAEPLVRKVCGGREGGGAELTETGRAFLTLYRDLQNEAGQSAGSMSARFTALLPKE